MAEKDRKPGQNGKGSDSRVSNIKRYKSNWEQIDWKRNKSIKRDCDHDWDEYGDYHGADIHICQKCKKLSFGRY